MALRWAAAAAGATGVPIRAVQSWIHPRSSVLPVAPVPVSAEHMDEQVQQSITSIADEVVVMQHGRLVEHATTDEVFDHPQRQYTKDLLDAIPGGKLRLGLD